MIIGRLRNATPRPRHVQVLAGAVLALLVSLVAPVDAQTAAPGAPGAPGAEPTLRGVAATRYMGRLARQLRAQFKDTPVAIRHGSADAVTLTMPVAWLFALDAVQLRPEATARLDPLVATLAESARTEVAVIGHADSLGTREFNAAFTLRRAVAVADLLQSRGIAPQRVTARGAGEAEPVDGQEASPAARQRNRRIEIVLRPIRPSRREAS